MQHYRDASTNPSIFLRLKETDTEPREIAWEQFHARYVPVITGFARRLGGKSRDVDDVVQEVLLGFYLKSPTFVYDPSKGRFRRYLKVCVYNALKKRFGDKSRLLGKPLDEVDPESIAVDNLWNDVWEQQLLKRAVEVLRNEQGHTKTFTAFEKYVLLSEEPQQIAKDLDLHINTVYRAKDQLTRLLKVRLAQLREDE